MLAPLCQVLVKYLGAQPASLVTWQGRKTCETKSVIGPTAVQDHRQEAEERGPSLLSFSLSVFLQVDFFFLKEINVSALV